MENNQNVIGTRQKELLKNTIILGIGYIVPALANLLVLPIYTEALTSEEYGIYDLFIVIASVVVSIITLRLDAGLFRFVIESRGNEKKIKYLVSTTFISINVINIFFLLAFILLGYRIEFYQRIMMGIYICITAIYNTFSSLIRGFGKNRIYTTVVCVQAVFTLIFSIVFVSIYKMKLIGVLMALNIGMLIAIVYACIVVRFYRYFAFRNYSFNVLKEVLSYSAPMVPNNISMWVVSMSDRLLITFFLGAAANGIYAIANKIPAFLNRCVVVFNASWQENASVYVNDDDAGTYFSNITITLMNILFGISAVLIAFTPVLLKMLIHQDYKAAYGQIPILIMGLLFSCMTSHLGSIFLALKHTRVIGVTSVLGAVMNVMINIVFIRSIGLYAASISTVISYLIVFLMRYIILYHDISMKIPWARLITGVGVFIVLSIMYMKKLVILDIFNIVISIIFAVSFNMPLIKTILKGAVFRIRKR